MIKLAQDEKVVLTIRKHWFLPFLHTLSSTILFLIPIIAIYLLVGKKIYYSGIELTLTFGQPSYLLFGLSLWGLVLWLRFFSFWTDHNLDGWVITDKRIIDVEQKGFFIREIASFRLERLQDVTSEVRGIIATLLDFGDIHVQTAGTDREFILHHAPNPKNIKTAILEQYDKIMDSNNIKKDVDAV